MTHKKGLIFGICLLIFLGVSFCVAEESPEFPDPAYRLAFLSMNNNLFGIHSDGTGLIRLTPDGANSLHPVWAPDGTKLLYLTQRAESLFSVKYSLWVTAADGTEQFEIATDCEIDSLPVWSPDSSQILFVEKYDGKKYPVVSTPDGKTKMVLKDYQLGTTFVNRLSWSPDGAKILGVFRLGGKDALATLELNGAAPVILLDKVGDYICPTWSSDGSRIAFGFDKILGIIGSKQGLYIIPATGGEPAFITAGKDIFNISWAPDDTAIAFTRRSTTTSKDSKGYYTTSYNYTSYVVNVNDKKPRPVKLTDKANAAECISWSPDSSKLAYTGFFMLGVLPSKAKIYKIKVPCALGAPSWSPDGAWIACTGRPNIFTRTSIYIASADGKKIFKLTNNGADSNPVWAPK
ncbi:MAG: hypothetical protein K6U80_02055 [Firmicutes bacterium]|nr:hypothetical protein [Bacillota bacterium]